MAIRVWPCSMRWRVASKAARSLSTTTLGNPWVEKSCAMTTAGMA